MPGMNTHRRVGGALGLAYAAYHARDLGPQPFAFESLGGLVGGVIGGSVPDVVEPAISSWHRSTAHSWALGGTAVASVQKVEQWALAMRPPVRVIPAGLVQRPTVPVASSPQFTWEMAIGHFLSGFLRGLLVGYISHLALDAGTKRGLPLLGGGCQ